MFGFSRLTWILLILADMILLAIDVPCIIFGTLSLGLALAAVLVFYCVIGFSSFIFFSFTEFLSGASFLRSVLNGFVAAVMLMIPFPVVSIVAYLFSAQSGYGRMYRAYSYVVVFVVLVSLIPVVCSQVQVGSPSRLSAWDAYCESVSYRVYEVSIAFTGDSLKRSLLGFCELRIVSRSNEFATMNVLIVQGSRVSSVDLKRSGGALARDVRIASIVASDVAVSVDGRIAVMRVVGLSSSALSSAQSVISISGSSGDVVEDVNEVSASIRRLALIGSGLR